MVILNLKFLFCFIFFFLGVFSFILNRKHFLSMLLSLEFIVLSLFNLIFFFFFLLSSEFYFSVVFLIFCVCEGVLGISILVCLIRSFGNDYFFSFSVLQC